jgi:hypothetical protein
MPQGDTQISVPVYTSTMYTLGLRFRCVHRTPQPHSDALLTESASRPLLGGRIQEVPCEMQSEAQHLKSKWCAVVGVRVVLPRTAPSPRRSGSQAVEKSAHQRSCESLVRWAFFLPKISQLFRQYLYRNLLYKSSCDGCTLRFHEGIVR